jgi:hypothetical protein
VALDVHALATFVMADIIVAAKQRPVLARDDQ